MPRKGYRSLTLPENVYQRLIEAASMYRTTAPKTIRLMIQSAHQAPPDDNIHGNPARCTVQIEGLDKFREWLKVRKGISEDTVRRYMEVMPATTASPGDFIKYSKWGYLAFRNYIHFRYQMGLLSAEEKFRWLDLLKIRRGSATEPPEVKEEDVCEMMAQPHENIVDVLYWSGIRITEAAYIGNNTPPFEDFDGFRRYAVGWVRGNKRCDYAYIPNFVGLKPCELDFNHLHEALPMLPKMLRKFFYRVAKRTALENRADPLIADFYQSRVSKMSVGERHYGELRSEADHLYPKVMEALNRGVR